MDNNIIRVIKKSSAVYIDKKNKTMRNEKTKYLKFEIQELYDIENKTEVMVLSKEQQQIDIQINNTNIGKRNNFKYLEIQLENDGKQVIKKINIIILRIE